MLHKHLCIVCCNLIHRNSVGLRCHPGVAADESQLDASVDESPSCRPLCVSLIMLNFNQSACYEKKKPKFYNQILGAIFKSFPLP